MKTKVNEVPLVGPRGRKELLDRINELEDKIIALEMQLSSNIKGYEIDLSSFDETNSLDLSEAEAEKIRFEYGCLIGKRTGHATKQFLFESNPQGNILDAIANSAEGITVEMIRKIFINIMGVDIQGEIQEFEGLAVIEDGAGDSHLVHFEL